MGKLIIVAGSLAVFGTGWCFGQTKLGNEGNSWHILPHVARAFYVRGFSQGYQYALLHEGVLTIAKNTPEKVSSMKPAERNEYEQALRWAKRIVPSELNPTQTMGEREGALDTFYSDYRNTPVCLEDAILFSVASPAGNAAPDQELEAARKKDAESGCK